MFLYTPIYNDLAIKMRMNPVPTTKNEMWWLEGETHTLPCPSCGFDYDEPNHFYACLKDNKCACEAPVTRDLQEGAIWVCPHGKAFEWVANLDDDYIYYESAEARRKLLDYLPWR